MTAGTRTTSGRILRGAGPFVTTLLLALFAAVPMRLPGIAAAPPDIVLIAVCYWSIYSPRLMPASAVFVLGLLTDILSGGVPGVNAIVLLSVRFIALLSRRTIRDNAFGMIWASLSLIILAAAALEWTLAALIAGGLPDALPLVFVTLSTIAAFPLAWLPMVWLHRLIVSS